MTPIPVTWIEPAGYAEGNRLSPQWSDSTGRRFTLKDAPVGAVWDCDWLHDTSIVGPDGRSLCAKCPGGQEWLIDSRASNCTLKADKVHRCWVRHGRPEDGTLHVDKNGATCAAGAGSIQTSNWHGFLHHGKFVA